MHTLLMREAVVQWDFGKVPLHKNMTGTTATGTQDTGDPAVQVLTFVITSATREPPLLNHKITPENSKLSRLIVDVTCSNNYNNNNNNDYFFSRAGLMELFRSTHLNPLDYIYFFSDGGSKHFKCSYTMALFAVLANPSLSSSTSTYQPHTIIDTDVINKLRLSPKTLMYHFCALYHGHSLADGHFSQLKRLANAVYNQVTLPPSPPHPHSSQFHDSCSYSL